MEDAITYICMISLTFRVDLRRFVSVRILIMEECSLVRDEQVNWTTTAVGRFDRKSAMIDHRLARQILWTVEDSQIKYHSHQFTALNGTRKGLFVNDRYWYSFGFDDTTLGFKKSDVISVYNELRREHR